jgi:hypothetical protein
MNSKELQKIFQTVARNLRCPHCGKRYAFDKIHIVSSTNRICVLSLECQGHMPMMASVAVSGQPTALEESGITSDELIDGYKKLSHVDSFEELFK